MPDRFDVVIFGLSLSSSWNNCHATTYRALVKGLARRGRRVLFLEREQPGYAEQRDFTRYQHCQLEMYADLEELQHVHAHAVREATAVIVGSHVPEGIAVAKWVLSVARGVRAFYDIDTPVTLQALAEGTCEHLEPALIPNFDLYLSFTGGPTLQRLQREWGARRAAALYCAVDAGLLRPMRAANRVDLGYLGTYSADRQPRLVRLLLESASRASARRFIVAGADFPSTEWPANVVYQPHVAQSQHAMFFSSQRFTLNLTRDAMIAAGYSPSVRLFEAAACAVPIISDPWPGIEEFFEPGSEILLARETDEVLAALERGDERWRRSIGAAARARVLAAHTCERRAAELDALLGLGAPTAPRTITRGRPVNATRGLHA